MADNPRDLLRAAQSAEIQGDVARAVEYLQKAAEAYRKAGNAPRALQLLRHARKLDGSRVDIAEEVNRLEWMPETLLARPRQEDDEDSRLASELERSLEAEPLPERVLRQRLIEDALREAGMAVDSLEGQGEVKTWVIETEVAEDLQRLEVQLARVAASVDVSEVARAGGAGIPPAAASVAAPDFAAEGQGSALAEDGSPDTPPRRRREKRLIDRGPTRADAALDAWCSFCCRPRAEVGDLVAGPAGAFICKGCLSESLSLLGDVSPASPPARPRPMEPSGAFMELVGQAEARGLLDGALQAGARCLLAVGPEGCGKSVWFQQLQRQERGVLISISALEQAPPPRPLLVEDVDRLDAAAQATLAAFLARHPRHLVLLSARGLCPDTRGPVLRNDSSRVPVPTTAVLTQSVRGAVPVSLLEHVQVLLPLHAPTQADYMEIARRRLALREPAVPLSEDVLAAFAAEAVRSPRAGHELHALLSRVPAGTWGLENAAKPASPRKGRRKGTS
ncbi:ClpX C4-type zinc finger protein [Myxococcus sp. RHSTA-1-4]|uniref:ClpX C4-type zinc finger protein n=1 Tax=Myxococcus sp. RHSTA-1-4 TaxID=2874601 RepID=UPI001CBB4A37|nr:ClpX C4-type zinc finger protein [Myxococcus sp. RHSTA-1-4]MBZ4420876.1 ClpX C4-type zinc finger protein [Myxococcus sp. RHSTA-1-4]